jgi:uncharacterized surface protein with fasciclin (FAS1) repeats
MYGFVIAPIVVTISLNYPANPINPITVKRLILKNQMLKNLSVAIVSLFLLPVVMSCASETAQAPVTPTSPAASPPQVSSTASPSPADTSQTAGSIVEIASTNPSLKTLTAAIQAAGLTSTLQGSGPFTVFAPTDQAFAAIPAATRQKVLQPENRKLLTRILTYHVVPGAIDSGALKSGKVNTVEGKPVDIQVNGAEVTVNNAKVTQPDIAASNGIIHVIDRIILPPDLNLPPT